MLGATLIHPVLNPFASHFTSFQIGIPFGKRLHNHGESPFSVGRSPFSIANYKRVDWSRPPPVRIVCYPNRRHLWDERKTIFHQHIWTLGPELNRLYPTWGDMEMKLEWNWGSFQHQRGIYEATLGNNKNACILWIAKSCAPGNLRMLLPY